MSIFDSLKLVQHTPQSANNPVVNRRNKLVDKIDEQISLATDAGFAPTKTKWVTDEDGTQRKVEYAKRVKRWWTHGAGGSVLLTVRYGSKPLEFAKGKQAIELANVEEVEPTLQKIKEAVLAGELDEIVEKQATYARSVPKAKR
ncbi:DUF6641 family protein [Halomonas sp. QHL1]|uniref:DUF6641 family protein n=1 Tax=Halomonas sp. QHL1 TaxID=1123773 RepID=UPI0008FD1635|nr:DUF6641 family protein [Halomonas sp. QHL1]OJA06899.1 hypothetical protein QHL1GM_16635 [Halomonas sp. QHL1]